MARWKCRLCGWIYDDEKEGTPFEQLPDYWRCRKCGAAKSRFAKI